jgi:hypothetical protein
MGWPLWASIERTDRILVYGASKPSSLSSTEAWLKLAASLVGLGEKLGTDPRIDQSVCCGFCREHFFSGVVGSIQIYRWLAKGCYMWTNTYVDGHTRTEHGKCVACWSGFPLQGVHRFKSSWLSDMSTACLWQSSCSKLINLMSLIVIDVVLL